MMKKRIGAEKALVSIYVIASIVVTLRICVLFSFKVSQSLSKPF